jgi:glutamate dehydrogenase
LGPAYLALKDVLNEANSGHAEVLNQIKMRFREETFTPQRILEAIQAYPELVSGFAAAIYESYSMPCFSQIRMLYINFAMVHYPNSPKQSQPV